MKKKTESEHLRGLAPYFYKGLTAFLVLAGALVFYFLLLRLGPISAFFSRLLGILQPIIFGLVIAYLLNPVVNFLRRHLTPFFCKHMKKDQLAVRLAKGLSVFAAILLLLCIIFLLGYMVIPELVASIIGMIRDLPGQIDNFLSWLNSLMESNSEFLAIVNGVLNYLKNWVQTDLLSTVNVLVGGVASRLFGVVQLLMNFVIGVIVAVYVLNSKERFLRQSKKLLYALVPSEYVPRTIHMLRKCDQIFGGFINGKLVDSLIVGVLCFIGLSILRMPYTLLVTVIIGVTNIIPVFGPYIGAVPSAALILLADPLQGLIFIVFVILLQSLDGNVIGPRIIGESTGLSSFWVVFSILVGGGLFGVVGMMIGAPAFGVIYYIVRSFIQNRLERRNLAHLFEADEEPPQADPSDEAADPPAPPPELTEAPESTPDA